MEGGLVKNVALRSGSLEANLGGHGQMDLPLSLCFLLYEMEIDVIPIK